MAIELISAPSAQRQGVYEFTTPRAMTLADFGTETHLRIRGVFSAADLVDPQTNVWLRIKRSPNGAEPWLPVAGAHHIGGPDVTEPPYVQLGRDVALGYFLRAELDILNRVRLGAVVEAVTP